MKNKPIGIQIHSIETNTNNTVPHLEVQKLNQSDTHAIYNQLERVGRKVLNTRLETSHMYNMLNIGFPVSNGSLWYLQNSNVTVLVIKNVIKQECLKSPILDARQIVKLSFRKEALKQLLKDVAEVLSVDVKQLKKVVEQMDLNNAIVVLALTKWKEKDKYYVIKYTVNGTKHKISICKTDLKIKI